MADSDEPVQAEIVPPDSDARDTYNMVSDTISGVNIRPRDNLIQAVVIGVCFVLGIVIGGLVTRDRILGLLAGGFVGVLAGLFGSGIFLMVYRFLRHTQGKHD